jgi:predicted transcriptional regulator
MNTLPKEYLNIRIESELKEKAKILAVQQKRSVSEIFEELIQAYISNQDKKEKKNKLSLLLVQLS